MGKLNIVSGNIMDYLENKDLIINSSNKDMKVNEIRFSPGFDLGIDILHIYCPKYYEYKNDKEALDALLFCYDKIVFSAIRNHSKNIVSVSLGTGINGYKHKDVAKKVVERLSHYASHYRFDFTLVLPNEEIKKLYNFYIN